MSPIRWIALPTIVISNISWPSSNVKPLPALWVLPAAGPGPGWQRLHVLRLTAQTVNDNRAIHHKMTDRPWLWLQVESSVLHLVLHEGHWLIWLKLGASRHVRIHLSNVASLQLWLGPLIWPSSLKKLALSCAVKEELLCGLTPRAADGARRRRATVGRLAGGGPWNPNQILMLRVVH